MGHNHATLFEAVATGVPDREAIVFRERRFTYRQVLERSNRLANALLAGGIDEPKPRGQLANWESGQTHVGVYLYNGNEYQEAVCGSNRARAVPFNVNYRYVEHELAYLLNDARPAVIIYHSSFAPTLAAVRPQLDFDLRLIQVADGSGHGLIDAAEDYEALLAASSPDAPPTDPDEDDLYVLYTGGTTGMPKGTLWRQADIFEAAIGAVTVVTGLNVASLETVAESAPGSNALRLMAAPPFMHGAAGWASLGTLLAGGTLVIQSEVTRLDPADVLRTMEREQVQSLTIVGDAFARPLCDEYEKGSYDLSSLVALTSGGATLSPSMRERLLDLLPSLIILDAGGASETGAQMSAMSVKGQAADLGIFTPNDTTCVVDDGKQYVVEPGHESLGWLAKKGAIPLGYLGDQKKSEATFPVIAGERMSIPGDRARLRADGMVELLGRESMTINSGGEKIFAEEVEQALISHPDVEDVLVVGRPNEKWGHEVVAVVQLHEGTDPGDEDLLAMASKQIARYKLPKEIIRVAKVERSPSGKADYAWAKRRAAS